MELNRDFQEFIELLNKHKVEYMIVGGYALAFHGKPRQTGDMDVWINNTSRNAEKMMKVVNEFGLGSLGLRKDDFIKEGSVTQIGYPPLRIDILNTIDGIKFGEAIPNSKTVEIKGQEIYFIGQKEFIQNKKASGRSQDLADIKEIQKKKRGRGS